MIKKIVIRDTATFDAGQICVRPYEIFFSNVTLPDGTEVEMFKEISI